MTKVALCACPDYDAANHWQWTVRIPGTVKLDVQVFVNLPNFGVGKNF